ncbi:MULTISPECIES: DUF6708 domain-containing protein [unclassified Pseudomonas]|uniref:DUF6708 domain-containing protein n=1 Tax=unclassified Pseudomonas TaxID=196821 RepID=UPI0035C23D90
MSIQWIFDTKTKTKTNIKPKIKGQVSSRTQTVLCLRNPWVTDSVFMGKTYTAMTVIFAAFDYSILFHAHTHNLLENADLFLIGLILGPFIFTPFLAYRIIFIKKLSNIYLNRETKKIYYQRFRKNITFDWNNIGGGIFARTEFGGASFSTSYALAFAPRREDGSLHKMDCLWIDSNEPTEPSAHYVAEVWEYLRHFMDHGLDKLPPPDESNWWHRPLEAICLTPSEAWRHYAPWRTGEPGEMQGKKLWQLPFWAVLFPYNFSLAVCWYLICRLFNVQAAPAPPEAFEDAPTQPGKRKRK